AELCRLLAHHEQLLVLAGDEIAVAGRIHGDRRIDVEAVDLRTLRFTERLYRGPSVGAHHGRVEVLVAYVAILAPAEPLGRIRVRGAHIAGIGVGRGLALRLHEPGARQGQDGRQQGEYPSVAHALSLALPAADCTPGVPLGPGRRSCAFP